MAVGEWDQRQLCSDGACIGVIGPDGTCKVCGRAAANWGDERKRGLLDPPDADADDDEDEDDEYEDGDGDGDDEYEDDDEDDEDEDDDVAAEPAVAAAPGEWTSRRLCPDGGCVGVIGPDGRCKVCGRSASGAAARAKPAEVPALEAAAMAASTTDADAAPTAAPAADPLRTFLGGVPDGAAVAAAAEAREPCPDAACKGHIGGDGRCDVCGKGAS